MGKKRENERSATNRFPTTLLGGHQRGLVQVEAAFGPRTQKAMKNAQNHRNQQVGGEIFHRFTFDRLADGRLEEPIAMFF